MSRLPATTVGRAALALAVLVAGCAGAGEGADGADAAMRPGDGRRSALATGGAVITPQQLLGLDADQLTSLIGPADFRRNDGPAEIRQFRDTGCVLDVFLYADATTGGYRVEHVDARDRTPGPAVGQSCIAGLLQQRRARAAG